MKGLQEANQNRTTFLVIKHSTICEESKQERPGFKPVEVTNPRTKETITKYIKPYNGVEAMVCKIEWYTREFEDKTFRGWKLHLDAAGVPCVLDLPFDSRAAGRFMKLAENIDYTQPVEFRAWHDAKTDSTAFFVAQGGKSVPQLYTKENPGKCPPPTRSTVTGKWNFEAQSEFLFNRMTEVVIPTVERAGNVMPGGEEDGGKEVADYFEARKQEVAATLNGSAFPPEDAPFPTQNGEQSESQLTLDILAEATTLGYKDAHLDGWIHKQFGGDGSWRTRPHYQKDWLYNGLRSLATKKAAEPAF
jgi:hypothetical protein